MKISRRKTLVAAMSLAVFGLAACGKKEEAKPEAAPASTVAATAAAEPLKVGFIYVSQSATQAGLMPTMRRETGRS
jgi:simple sugar transport system substrate-binding protein